MTQPTAPGPEGGPVSVGQRLIPRLPRAAWVVLGGDALSAVGSGLTLPFLLVYLHRVRGLDLGVAGLAVAAVALASLVGNPLGGWLADRLGARNTVVFGLLAAAAGAVAVTLVRDAAHAFAAAGTMGLGAGVIWPAQDALLAGLVAPEQRSAAFSVRHATLNAGFGVGALGAAAIVSSSGSFVALYLLDAISFLVFVPILLTLPDIRPDVPAPGEGPPPAGGYRLVFRDRLFRRVWALTALVVAVSYGQYASGFPAYATRPGGISPGALSLAFAANTFAVVGAQLVVLRMLRGCRRTFALRLACAGWAAAWAVTLVGGRLGGGVAATAAFALAMVVFGLAETCLSPTLAPIVNDLAPDALRGRYNGASTLAWTTGFLAGPAVAGFALQAGAGSALFAGLIVACALAATGARRLEAHLPDEANRVSV